MNEIYHLRIQGTTGQEAVLAFPSGIASRVDQIFQEQYKSGREFAKALEDRRQDVLDAIAFNYPSDRKTLQYCIEGDKLILKPVASQGQNGQIQASHSQNEMMATMVMAMFLGNYLQIRAHFSSVEGPVTIHRTLDEQIDASYMKNANPPADEWEAIFAGEANRCVERKYIRLEPILTDSN